MMILKSFSSVASKRPLKAGDKLFILSTFSITALFALKNIFLGSCSSSKYNFDFVSNTSFFVYAKTMSSTDSK